MMHSEKNQLPVESKSTSQPLKIDSPDSIHEKEAASFAENITRNGQIMGSQNTLSGQIKGNLNPKNGMIAPAGVKEQINSAKGSGEKLPESVKRMMKGNSGELDDVQMHTDNKAAEVAKVINAKAFTYGKDIFFGQGMFDIYSVEGKELIAHELAHTLQQFRTNLHDDGSSIIQRQEKPGRLMHVGESLASVAKFSPSTLVLTDFELHEYIATVMAESAQGAVQPKEVAWVYYNIINDGVAKGNTVEEALHASVAASGAYDKKTKTYAGPNGWWKGYMTGLGETKYQNEKIESYMVVKGLPSGSTYADYIKTEYYVNHTAPIVEEVKSFITNTILKKPTLNPYPGYHNQGYYVDFNRKDRLWQTARAYFWLQKDGSVTDLYVKELYAGTNTTFLFNSEKILAYFEKNPTKLPTSVPEYDPKTRDKRK